MLFLPEKWHSRFGGWISFLRRCLKKTRALLVVIDRGFRFLQAILESGRQFLIRADIAGLFPDVLARKPSGKQRTRGRKPKFPGRRPLTLRKYLRNAKHIREIPADGGILLVIPGVIVKAWPAPSCFSGARASGIRSCSSAAKRR